jgi:hypothetical protein
MAFDYPIAAFTVKHELRSWLKKRNRAALEKDCQIYRLHDGDCECHGRITAVDIEEILK